jgi:hypothetical protein
MAKNRRYRERSELSRDSHDIYLVIARDPAHDSAHELMILSRSHEILLTIALTSSRYSRYFSRSREILLTLGVGGSSIVGVGTVAPAGPREYS